MRTNQLNVCIPDTRDEDFRNFLFFLNEESRKEADREDPCVGKIEALTYANEVFCKALQSRAAFKNAGETPFIGDDDDFAA